LRTCEDYLLKNLDNINVSGDPDENDELTTTARPDDSSSSNLPEIIEKNRISLEKLKGEGDKRQMPMPTKSSGLSSSANPELQLVGSIVDSTQPGPHSRPIQRIEDISPIDFKRDLLLTTDWHLYYKKLSALGVLVREKTYWPYFNQVFMVSSLENDGVDDLRRYLFSRAKPGNWIFSRNLLTDQMPQDIAQQIVREKLLENVQDEVPYFIDIQICYWEIDESDRLNIAISLVPGGKKQNAKRQIVIFFNYFLSILKLSFN
jgi:hypothetical protein